MPLFVCMCVCVRSNEWVFAFELSIALSHSQTSLILFTANNKSPRQHQQIVYRMYYSNTFVVNHLIWIVLTHRIEWKSQISINYHITEVLTDNLNQNWLSAYIYTP